MRGEGGGVVTTMTVTGYADAYPIYRDLGWHPIKLHVGTKDSPPVGFTGHKGAVPSGADMHAWAEEEPGGNIALRLSEEYVGIDVDDYGDKTGAATLAEAETRWGKLPYSPQSSSKGPGTSGIRLYRIPAGTMFPGNLKFPGGLEHVDIIQRHHRIVVCWPSVHDLTGATYRWYGIDGGELDRPPAPADIPDLPQKWLDNLAKPERPNEGTALGSDGPYNVRQALTEGEPSQRVAAKLGRAIVDCAGGSRHDTIRDHVLGLLRCGKQGEPGVEPALLALQRTFVAAVEKDRKGGREEAEAEFRNFWKADEVAVLLADESFDDGANVTEVPREFFTSGTESTEEPDGTPQLAAWCLTRAQLASLPEPEPLIDNVLDKSSVALLYGKWGSGKSFIAMDWAACIATGKAWQGRQVEQQRVLYLAAEGAHGMKIRADSWEAGWQSRIPDEQFTVLRRAINLTDYRQVAELAALIDWGGYGFVVIDTIARCMVGADENSAKDCGVVVDALGRLLDKTPGGRGAVTGVHHTGKDGRTFRGSSVFEAGADTVYSVLAEGHAINLNREKRKDGPIADMHGLTIEAVEGTKSCIISLHRGVEKPERAQRLLSTFLHHFSTTGATKTELRVVSDLTEGTFYRALSDLVQSGDLVNEGTEKRPFYKAVIR